jgi:hypothetical protein
MVSQLSAQGAIPASIIEAAAAGDTMAFARIPIRNPRNLVRQGSIR